METTNPNSPLMTLGPNLSSLNIQIQFYHTQVILGS